MPRFAPLSEQPPGFMPSISWRWRRAICPASWAGTPFSISIPASSDPAALYSIHESRSEPALLSGLWHLLHIVRVAQVHRSVRFEGVGEAQFLADLAHRGHHLLAQQADAGLGVFGADRAVVTPKAINARARLFENSAQFRNDRVGRSVDNPPVRDLLFECRPSARALCPPNGELDKLAAMLGREIARRARPYRMR